jgi:phosphoribosylamine--glycine ligase
MKILVVGSGGREHAIAWKLSQSPRCTALYATRPNAGMASLAEAVDLDVTDIDGLLDFAKKVGIELTVVGPELPLTLGIVDLFENAGLAIWGPSREAARLEGSKAFAKSMMARAGVPTAEWMSFDSVEPAIEWVHEFGKPVVVKADGLAAGKGVVLCHDTDSAVEALRGMMNEGAFGAAGAKVVVEELLLGEEVSFIALCDGETIQPLASSQDHKRIGEGDTGPNTGGMGAYSPAPILPHDQEQMIIDTVMAPVLSELARDGHVFKGFLYAGIMLTADGPKVLEFNVRLGDPETQPLMMRLKTDLVELLWAGTIGRLKDVELQWDMRPAMCVVCASAGYPASSTKGDVIQGLKEAGAISDVVVFHAGTRHMGEEAIVNGGRVLGVTALGASLADARAAAYQAVNKISWPGMQVRRDIGWRAL